MIAARNPSLLTPREHARLIMPRHRAQRLEEEFVAAESEGGHRIDVVVRACEEWMALSDTQRVETGAFLDVEIEQTDPADLVTVDLGWMWDLYERANAAKGDE